MTMKALSRCCADDVTNNKLRELDDQNETVRILKIAVMSRVTTAGYVRAMVLLSPAIIAGRALRVGDVKKM